MPLDARLLADVGDAYYRGQASAQDMELNDLKMQEYKRKQEQETLMRQKLQGITPGDYGQLEKVGFDVIGGGNLEQGTGLLNIARQSQTAKEAARKERVDEKDKWHNRVIDGLLNSGDTEGANEYVRNNMMSDPDYKPLFENVKDFKILSKDKLTVTSPIVIKEKDDRFKNPITGETLEPGVYDVTVEASGVGKDGKLINPKPKKIALVEEKEGSEFQYFKNTQKKAGRTDAQILQDWDTRSRERSAAGGGDLAGLNRSLKELQLENMKEGKIRQNREDVTKAMDYAKDELTNPKNFEGFGQDKKLKPSVYDSIKVRLNSVGKDIATDVTPGKKGGIFKDEVPEKFNYRIVDKKEQASPPPQRPIVTAPAPQGGGLGAIAQQQPMAPPVRPQAAPQPRPAPPATVAPVRPKPSPQGQPGGQAPPLNTLKEGKVTTFKNGQSWTLKNGVPQRLN